MAAGRRAPGGTQDGQQYAGWKQLGSGGSTIVPRAMTVEDAAEFVAVAIMEEVGIDTMEVLQSAGVYRQAYRDASKKLHPDRGGNTEEFQRLQEAKRVLDAHHGA